VRDTDFDYAFHLAALVGGRLMIEKQPLSVAEDLSIDAAFWQWAKAVRPKKCVYLSSSAAYPIAGILATMDALTDGRGLNLSTCIFTSFIDFAKIAGKELGVSPDLRGTSDMPEGVFARGGDTKLQEQLGFSPIEKYWTTQKAARTWPAAARGKRQ
jgi:hypothetical protein